MRRVANLLLMTLCLQFLAGCSLEAVRQGVYEGAKTRNGLQQTPSERLGQPDGPGYAEYQRMRQEKK